VTADRNIYVGNLPPDADEAELRGLFSAYGEVLDLVVVRDETTRESRGFGFLQLPPDRVLAAVDALDGFELRGHRLRVNVARNRGEKPPRRRF